MHKFDPSHAHRLEHPDRYSLIPPLATLKRLGLQSGMRFLDVGAGTGFFSRHASTIVGSGGRVYAVDTSAAMLELMAKSGVRSNTELIHSGEYAIPLPAQSVDLALLAFVLHENRERDRLLEEVSRVVTPEGKIALIEWKKQEEDAGPPIGERLAEEDLEKELAHFTILQGGSLNASHYYRIIRRSPSAV